MALSCLEPGGDTGLTAEQVSCSGMSCPEWHLMPKQESAGWGGGERDSLATLLSSWSQRPSARSTMTLSSGRTAGHRSLTEGAWGHQRGGADGQWGHGPLPPHSELSHPGARDTATVPFDSGAHITDAETEV